MFRILIIFIFFLGQVLFRPGAVLAQEAVFEGRITRLAEEKEIIPAGGENSQLYQRLEIIVTAGPLKGQTLIIENGDLPAANLQRYSAGDAVVLSPAKDYQGNDRYYISDYVRRGALGWLLAIFMVMAVAVGRWQGVSSLIGMGITFAVIFWLVLPRIAAGGNPLIAAALGSLAIIPATFVLSHGPNKKTGIAIAGTVIALLITVALAYIFVAAARLTGFAAEEASFLQAYHPGLINIKDLLLAGIIIGVLGVLDDITVSQAAVVEQLRIANPRLAGARLYNQAMAVGRDHIASMINTLILVYTGAALPLLLIFINNPRPFAEIINLEILADEIVRTLVGSIGLMLAVPITTLIAVVLAGKK